MWLLMGTYGRVAELYQAGYTRQAGEEFALSLFPTKREKTGNVEWPKLPWFWDITEGEELSGLLSGMLYRFSNEEKFDNLVGCVTNQDRIVADITEAVETMFGRRNDDIIDSVAQLRHFFNGLDLEVQSCNSNTKGQVSILQEKVDEVMFDDEKIIENLARYMEHIELMMARIKLEDMVHDYMELGYNLADIYLTLNPVV